ncbi:hypothetical protein KKE14_01045 [Patescibacteria group bacterium]|nr:hypothetical protein [Patescibacteria group bacterium]
MLPTKIITRDKLLSLNSPMKAGLELPKINKTKAFRKCVLSNSRRKTRIINASNPSSVYWRN